MTRNQNIATFTKRDGEWLVRVPDTMNAEPGDEITVILKSGATKKITLDPNFWLDIDDGHLGRPAPETTRIPRKVQRERGTNNQIDFAAKLIAKLSPNDRHDLFGGEFGIDINDTPSFFQLQSLTKRELSQIIDTIKGAF